MAVEKNIWAFSYVPQGFITPELCETSVKKSGQMLNDFQKEFITEELWKIAMRSEELAVYYKLEELKTGHREFNQINNTNERL